MTAPTSDEQVEAVARHPLLCRLAMAFDTRITGVAKIAAEAAGKNVRVAPELLFTDIMFTLVDAVKDGRLLLPALASSPREEVEHLREAGQAEGFAAAVSWLRERSAMKPPASLWYAAAILADQLERSRIAAKGVERG